MSEVGTDLSPFLVWDGRRRPAGLRIHFMLLREQVMGEVMSVQFFLVGN